MKTDILIVEDEPLLANRITRLIDRSTHIETGRVTLRTTLDAAQDYLSKHTIDLLFLDLNLHGKDGFTLLKSSIVGESFHIIVVSAYTEKAIEAFDLGVLDFISKPFNQERVDKALKRFSDQKSRAENPVKFLAIKKNKRIELIAVDKIIYLRGAGNYTELHLADGGTKLHNKSLQRILHLLPSTYARIHKSYIVNLNFIDNIQSNYQVILKNGEQIPISRSKYAEIKETIS